MITIEMAAIRDHDGTVYTVPRPGRHHHVIRLMADKGIATPITGEQGFVTSEGKFVRRTIAGQIAIKAGQIEVLKCPPQLYSEDLW